MCCHRHFPKGPARRVYLTLSWTSQSLSYGSRTELEVRHAARHGNRSIARKNRLNAITRIRNDEAVRAGGRLSACAIPDRPAAAPSTIPAKALGTRTGRRIKRGRGANNAAGLKIEAFRTGN